MTRRSAPRNESSAFHTYGSDSLGDYSLEPVEFHWLPDTSPDEAELYAEMAYQLTTVARETREYRDYHVDTSRKTVGHAHESIQHGCPAPWLCPMDAYDCAQYDWSPREGSRTTTA